MTPEKREEIKQLFLGNIDLTVKEVEEGYIFGTYANNEHYLSSDIYAIRQEAYLELNPAPVVEDLIPNEE